MLANSARTLLNKNLRKQINRCNIALHCFSRLRGFLDRPDTKTDGGPGLPVNATEDPYVEFEHVQKSYDGEILVIKDLNLAMAKGEFLTMLGPSGSGKTTCLMMLAGFETATHGEIRLGGQEINNIPPPTTLSKAR